MFELVRPGTNFDFVGARRITALISVAFVLVGLATVAVKGLNYGIDFAGGTMVHLRFLEPVEIGQVRSAVGETVIRDATVQDFGGGVDEFLVRVPEVDPDLKKGLTQSIHDALAGVFGEQGFEVLRVESVGPRVGSELRRRATLAVLAAMLVMGIYITLRFEIRFGIGAAVALVHDVTITVGALTLTGYEFDLNILAALLTVVGYSVNDTVIISDRIRENLRKNRRDPLAVVLNRSVNETLSRTVLTTGTSLLVLTALFLLGGEILRGFAFTLLVGLTVGTYSSIFVVGMTVLALERSPAARTS